LATRCKPEASPIPSNCSHTGLGIQASHFQPFWAALLHTLAAINGADAWTDDARAAWGIVTARWEGGMRAAIGLPPAPPVDPGPHTEAAAAAAVALVQPPIPVAEATAAPPQPAPTQQQQLSAPLVLSSGIALGVVIALVVVAVALRVTKRSQP